MGLLGVSVGIPATAPFLGVLSIHRRDVLWCSGQARHTFILAWEPVCSWDVNAAKLDWPKFMKKKRAELQRLNSVYGNILGGANVEMTEVCSLHFWMAILLSHCNCTGPQEV